MLLKRSQTGAKIRIEHQRWTLTGKGRKLRLKTEIRKNFEYILYKTGNISTSGWNFFNFPNSSEMTLIRRKKPPLISTINSYRKNSQIEVKDRDTERPFVHLVSNNPVRRKHGKKFPIFDGALGKISVFSCSLVSALSKYFLPF